MAKGKPKRKPFGMNSSLADATQVMRQLPVSAMLSSIEMQINILQERGVEITQTWHCPSLPSRFRLLDLGPDIGGLEPEQMHCPGRTGYILESRRSRPGTTISNSAIRKARTETETHNRFIDKTSNRVVYFEKQGREVDPSPKRKS